MSGTHSFNLVLALALGVVVQMASAEAEAEASRQFDLPGDLPYAATPRPWGDTYLPKSNPPVRHLLAVELAPLKPEERVAAACLQGLTSRSQPRLWLLSGELDRVWLDWHREKGHIGGYEIVTNCAGLFHQFTKVCRGAIIADTNLYCGGLLALNIAACEDLVLATPDLAHELDLPVKMDLRGRFKTYAEGMRWVWTNYQAQLNHHLCDYMAPDRVGECKFAYDYQWKAVAVWITGKLDGQKPGADQFAETQLMARIFAEMEPNIAVLGFPYGGEDIGIGEGGGVKLASLYAKGLVCTDSLLNTCVMSGVRAGRLVQPKQPPPPRLDRKSIYLALVMSDGDNENTWLAFFKNYFNHRAFGKFPLAFGMGPPIRELMPAVAQWYYEHASPQTEFIADVSGVAYIDPESYGRAFKNRAQVLEEFLGWSAREMQPMGMRTVRSVGGEDDELARYAKALPFCHSIFADMGRYSGREGIERLTYSLPGGKPVFRAVTSWRYGKDGFLREVREQVGSHRPAFVNGFVHCWTFDPADLERIYKSRDKNMVFVTPTQLAALYLQAKDKGWTE
jgi:hypothetical protein